MSDALEKVHEEIPKMTPQGAPHCTDRHKMEYLQYAVIGNSWARDACSRADAGKLTYHELYSQPEAAIQLEQREKLSLKRPIKPSSKSCQTLTIIDSHAMAFLPETVANPKANERILTAFFGNAEKRGTFSETVVTSQTSRNLQLIMFIICRRTSFAIRIEL